MLRHLPYAFGLASAFVIGFFVITLVMSEGPVGPNVTLTLDRSGIKEVDRFSVHAKSRALPRLPAMANSRENSDKDLTVAALPKPQGRPLPPGDVQPPVVATRPPAPPVVTVPPEPVAQLPSIPAQPMPQKSKKDTARIQPSVPAPTEQVARIQPFTQQIRRDPVRPLYRPESNRSLTKLVAFEASPFPYDGLTPRSKKPFLNFEEDGRVGRKTPSGRLYWADETYSDQRVLLHVPKGFDTKRPGVMVVFFHGHGATLERDVAARQRLPAQITQSGKNAILVAPQFAVNARDSSAGNFWKPGGMRRFLDEVADKLTTMNGDPSARKTFANMPVVLIGYSGGFMPTAAALSRGQISKRVAGVVLLDGLYSSVTTFADWIENHRSAFFLSAYTGSTRRGNHALREKLKDRDIEYSSNLGSRVLPGSVTIMAVDEEHRDYVTRAWVDDPVSDLLVRMTGIAHRTSGALSAALSPDLTR